MQNIIDIASN